MTYLGRPKLAGTEAQACDLCFRPLTDRDHVIVDLRAVCSDCLMRFSEEEPEVNRTLGLMKRGSYSEGRIDPGLNETLGGR